MKTLTYQQLTKMIEPGKNHPVLVNTLPTTHFLKGHIPGSVNIPTDQIAVLAPKLFGKHDWIVVYCANTQCDASEKAADLLKGEGFLNVYRFIGGLEEWQKHSQYIATETDAPKPRERAA